MSTRGTGLAIPTDVTLAGGANDVWVFQVSQTLDLGSGADVVFSGGAQARNVFWQVAGQATLATGSPASRHDPQLQRHRPRDRRHARRLRPRPGRGHP